MRRAASWAPLRHGCLLRARPSPAQPPTCLVRALRSRDRFATAPQNPALRADVPTPVYVHVQAGVIDTLRQIPTMNLPGASLHRKFPVPWTIFLGGPAFRGGVQRKHSAQSVILSA